MAAFQFPDPLVGPTTVVNPITGSTYQWKEIPGKWVVTTKIREVGDIVWEGDNPPDPIGDYKLWYSTDTLELYFYYCDEFGVCAWVPTSVPIQVLEDLNAFAAQAEVDIDQLQYKQQLLQNAVDQIYLQQQQGNYVKKVGGDEMEGPLSIQAQSGMGSREARRINTLGVFSNSDNSALRLGTTRDRVYIGHDDTSFNGPIKVDEIQEKNAGNGVKVANDLKMSMQQIKNLGAATEDNDALPYGQFISELQDFRDDVLEELTIGTWDYNALNSNVSPPPGAFIAWTDQGTLTNAVWATKYLRFYETDKLGHNIDWDRWDVGELLTLSNGPQKVSLRINAEPVQSANIVIVEVNYINSSNISNWVSVTEWAVKLTEFAEIDSAELDDTYLRLDCDNGPLTGDLDVSGAPEANDYGEGTINLLGRRTSAGVTCGKITFNNRADEDNAGIISYNTLNETGKFTINQDVKLDSGDSDNPASLNLASGGQIQQGGGKRITFKAASNGNDGSGLVEFSRPGNIARRGVSIRGNIVDPRDDTKMVETDLLYSYTNGSGTPDAVNYLGKSDSGNNIVNYKTMVDYIDDVLGVSLQNYEQINYELLKEDLTIVEGTWSGSAEEGNLKIEDLDGVSTHVGWMPNNTGKIFVGQPLKFTHDSGVRYGRVEAVWTNSNTTHLTVGDWMGDDFVDGEKTTVEYQKTLFATEEYVDSHIKESVLHLGSYSYARSTDSFSTGDIKSNTSTNPANITEISIHRTNNNGIDWTKGFFDRNIKEKMYVSLRKTSSDYYQGKVTGIVAISSGIKLQLQVVKSAGIFQLGQGIDVSLSYNKSEGAVALNTTSDYTVDDEGDLHFGDHLLEDIKDPESAQDAATKNYVDVKIEELENQSASSGRVIITPLEFVMDNYSGYPSDNQIAGLTSGGNTTTSRDVYGYHIPWKWFEQNHPELIGFIYTENGNLINNREASLSVRTLNGSPGIEIRNSSHQTRYATVTIQGWHVQVDDISEDQYTHKF